MDEAQDTCNYYQAMEELRNYSKEFMEPEYNVQIMAPQAHTFLEIRMSIFFIISYCLSG